MSNTPIQITTDLSEVLNRIEQKIDKLDEKFSTKLDKLDERLNKLEIGHTEIRGDIKALDEKVNGLSKRVENQEFINRGVLISIIIALVGGFVKLFGFVSNP
ncbi:conserved hypothetical protein [Gloeothece citriformis PCC 7424]|uniref:Phosphomannomutase n=1 Tax=Gloeothece citriformis (strain PCC 7424) TaxID=65393 RepID=B7KAB9_GLOC7|nr:hypothetical protein [Gloeothece citriformis]ACK72893.1 conserved hypothetical protein [Gloeothece citriformis PCC 7424]